MIPVKVDIYQKTEDFYKNFFSQAAKDGKEERLDYCIKKAWADATQRERFNGQRSEIIKNKESIKKILTEQIESIIKGETEIKSSTDYDNWHKAICLNKDYGMKYGIWQKFVNMTFKYMYCFNKIKRDFSDVDFVFKYCHCPIDSIIAQRAVTLCIVCGLTPSKEIVSIARSEGRNWNNMSETEYKTVRKDIQAIKNNFTVNNSNPTELEFDFLFW